MTTKVGKVARRCAHPKCADIIEPGETYEVIEREPYHLECALVRAEETKAAIAKRNGAKTLLYVNPSPEEN